MKTTGLVLLASHLLLVVQASSQIISDPLQDFKSQWDMAGVTKIYKLTADVNNDGLQDVFLSIGQSDPPDDKVLSWQLYIAKSDGKYLAATGLVTDAGINPSVIPSFNRYQYWIGAIPELNRHGLLHLECGSGGQALCQLKAVVIDGNGWKDVPIGDPVNAEKNYDQLARRFSQTPSPAVQEINP